MIAVFCVSEDWFAATDLYFVFLYLDKAKILNVTHYVAPLYSLNFNRQGCATSFYSSSFVFLEPAFNFVLSALVENNIYGHFCLFPICLDDVLFELHF